MAFPLSSPPLTFSHKLSFTFSTTPNRAFLSTRFTFPLRRKQSARFGHLRVQCKSKHDDSTVGLQIRFYFNLLLYSCLDLVGLVLLMCFSFHWIIVLMAGKMWLLLVVRLRSSADFFEIVVNCVLELYNLGRFIMYLLALFSRMVTVITMAILLLIRLGKLKEGKISFCLLKYNFRLFIIIIFWIGDGFLVHLNFCWKKCWIF